MEGKCRLWSRPSAGSRSPRVSLLLSATLDSLSGPLHKAANGRPLFRKKAGTWLPDCCTLGYWSCLELWPASLWRERPCSPLPRGCIIHPGHRASLGSRSNPWACSRPWTMTLRNPSTSTSYSGTIPAHGGTPRAGHEACLMLSITPIHRSWGHLHTFFWKGWEDSRLAETSFRGQASETVRLWPRQRRYECVLHHDLQFELLRLRQTWIVNRGVSDTGTILLRARCRVETVPPVELCVRGCGVVERELDKSWPSAS